jgi:hypothetical protein
MSEPAAVAAGLTLAFDKIGYCEVLFSTSGYRRRF